MVGLTMAFEMSDKLSALRMQNRGSEYIPPDPPAASNPQRENITQVLGSTNDVSQAISLVSSLIQQIRHNHEVILTSVYNQAVKDNNEQKTKELKSISRKIHAKLKELKQEINAERASDGAQYRIKKAQYTALSRRFRDTMEQYNQMMDDYRERSKDAIQRQLKYAGKDVSEEEVDKFLEEDNAQIFTQNISVKSDKLRQALGEVEARHMEIMRLETDIRELHELFYDMAYLVEEQGELVNIIERNVDMAALYVHRGQRKAGEAVVYHTAARKKRCCICCTVMIVSFVLLVIVVIIIGVAVAFVLNSN